MALKQRLGSYVYSITDDEGDTSTIKLTAKMGSMKALEEGTGLHFWDFLASCQTPMKMAELFYYIQDGTEYSLDEIYGCFFADVVSFDTPELKKKWEDLLFVLLNVDKQKALAKGMLAEKKADAPAA